MSNALVIWMPILILIILGLWWIATYNRLVALRELLRSAWSQIDVQLKRRHDLIPNLVETVKGYATHERGTLEAVIQARAAAMSAGTPEERQQTENTLTGTLKTLFAVAEAYPQLKANENFLALQEELTGTEGKIAYARQHYNDLVAGYNALVQSFPASLVAGVGRFFAEKYFELEAPSDRDTPQVKF